MPAVGFFGLFFGLLASGMPIFLVLGTCAAVLFYVSGEPMVGVAQVIIDQLNSSTLMALPLFVMAATFMRQGGVARALVNLTVAWLGGIRGSLGPGHGGGVHAVRSHLRIVGGNRTGDGHHPAPGDARERLSAAVRAGGDRCVGNDRHRDPAIARVDPVRHRGGTVGASAVPCGHLPGLLQATVFFAWVWWYGHRYNLPKEDWMPWSERLRVSLQAVPALIVPAVVLVGIYGGLMTVTEAAAVAAFVALLVSLFFYRGFHWTRTLGVVADSLKSAGTIMLIVATALALGHWMTESGLPARLVQFTLDHHLRTWEFLLAINVLLLVLGCFLEVTATLLLVLPILAPALKPLGVDPVHFSIIFTHNMEIGLVHPPVGLNLFVLSTISSAPVGEVIRGIFPFLILLLIVLGIITYVPVLTMWLPSVVYGS